jgi:hypothetical protein
MECGTLLRVPESQLTQGILPGVEKSSMRGLRELRSAARQLLYRYKLQELNDEGFRQEILRILSKFHRTGRTYLDIGLVIDERQKHMPTSETTHIWNMLDTIEPEIKRSFEHWRDKMTH